MPLVHVEVVVHLAPGAIVRDALRRPVIVSRQALRREAARGRGEAARRRVVLVLARGERGGRQRVTADTGQRRAALVEGQCVGEERGTGGARSEDLVQAPRLLRLVRVRVRARVRARVRVRVRARVRVRRVRARSP